MDDDVDDWSLDFGGVGTGGDVASGGVGSGSVRGSVAVIDLVEGFVECAQHIEDINDIRQ